MEIWSPKLLMIMMVKVLITVTSPYLLVASRLLVASNLLVASRVLITLRLLVALIQLVASRILVPISLLVASRLCYWLRNGYHFYPRSHFWHVKSVKNDFNMIRLNFVSAELSNLVFSSIHWENLALDVRSSTRYLENSPVRIRYNASTSLDGGIIAWREP